MGVLSAKWQRSAVQTHQAHGTETPVRTQNIFPDVVGYARLLVSLDTVLLEHS